MRRIEFITWAIASFVTGATSLPTFATNFSPAPSQLQALSLPVVSREISQNFDLQAQAPQSSNWILEYIGVYFDKDGNCRDSSQIKDSLILTGSSFSGQTIWNTGGQTLYTPIIGTITGNNVQLNFAPPDNTVPYLLNGSLNQRGEFVGTARILDGPCGGRSVPFTLRPESRTPQTIEEKRAFRKSDQQVAAELAALRERGKREGWTFEIGDSQAFRILLELLAGTRIPANFRPNVINILDILTRLIQEATRNNPQPVPPQPVPPQPVPPRPIPNPNQLPNRFDAREWGVVPEIRDQEKCGSCWAFAAVSAYEIAYSSLYKQPSGSLNLSEQQLLSCNRNNFSCSGGFISDKDFASRGKQRA